MSKQKDRVREAFTKQASSYASSAIISAEEARRGFVNFVGTRPNDRVLDIATGPGFLALLFAQKVAAVVGVDLTAAMVEQAEATRLKKGLFNICFQEGDAKSLTFPNSSFDIVTCGSAFHHFAYPNRVLAEMIRVTKQGGKVALIDIITSENTEHAALHNQLEQLRDPSHNRNLPLTELVALFEKAGLHDVRTATYATLRELDEWLAINRTSGALAERIRRAFIASIREDATGLNVHCEGDRICFTHTFAWVLGKRA